MSSGPFKDSDLAKLSALKVDDVALLTLIGDPFDGKRSHIATYNINETATRLKIVVRVQKYLAKFYVIRVA